MDENHNFFVGIYDPVDVRRNLLESSREIVSSLQSYDKLHAIRLQKLKLYQDMKKAKEELDMLISRLTVSLPKSYLRKAQEHSSLQPRQVYNTTEARTRESRFISELDMLEEQLRAIERQLSGHKPAKY